jgi:hypothetical protein
VFAACLGLLAPTSLLVDLAGDLPAVLGLPEPPGQGIADWLTSTAPPDALGDLTVAVDGTTHLLPRGSGPLDPASPRWDELGRWLHDEPAEVIVDAGVGAPPAELVGRGRGLLVTRACYLSLRRVAALGRPDGIVLITEPGRKLRAADVARSVGAPIVMKVSIDPVIARAVDAGLLRSRLPRSLQRELRGAA